MILQIKRGNRVIAESADFSYSPSLQEVRKLTCEVVSVVPIEFKAYNSKSESEYDTVVYNGNTFILYQAPSGDNLNEAGKYKYSLLFYGKEVLLQNVAFLDIVSGTGGEINKIRYTHGGLFQFWGDAKQLAARIEANIQSYNASLGAGYTGIGTWTLNVDAEGELTEDMIDITDGTNLFEALKFFYDKFYLNYYFSTTANGGIITITDKARPSVNWTFKQGDGGGAVKVSSSVDTSTPVITRIIPQGGSRNVPPEYKKDAKPADESRYCPYILLPNDSDGNIRYYIDSEYGLKNYGVRGKTISNTFSGIYPSIRGKKLGDLYPSGLPEWDTYKADGEPDPQSGKVAGEGASASTRIDKIIGSTPIKSDDSDSFFIYMTSPGFNLGYKVYEDGDSSDKINDNVQPQYKPHAMFDKYRDFERFDIYSTRAYYDQPVKVTATFSGKMLFSILPIGSDAVGKKVKINLRMVTNRVLGQASPLKEVVIGEEGATGMLEIPYDKTALVGYIEKGQNTTVTIRVEFTFDSDVPVGSCKIGFSEEMTCNIHFGNQDGSQDRFYYKYASVTDAVFSMRTGTYTGTEFKINKNGIIPLYGEVNGDTGETEEDVAMFNKGARYKISCYRTDSDNAKLPLYTDGKSPSIAAGTEFVILNIVMSESYVTMAENTLEKAALDYLSRYDHENRTVSLDISSGFVAEHPNLFIDFIEGNMLKVRDDGIGVFDFSDNGQIVDMQLQIQSLEIKYSKENMFPSYSCTIARRKILSFYERLAQENQTASTQNTTNVTLGGSGTGSGTNIFSEQLLNDLIASFQKFNGWFEWDEVNQALRCKSAFYTNQWISALGAQSGSGGGSGVVNTVYSFANLTDGTTFSDSDLDNTFNAYTIKKIYDMAGQGGLDATAMWNELKKADSSKVIDASHIPTSVLDGRWVTISTNQNITGQKTFTQQLKSTVATGLSPLIVSSNTVVSNLNADLLDGLHENSFLRYRDAYGNDGYNTLWSQIGIRQYNNASPDGMTGSPYIYGAVISLPSADVRFDIWYNHHSSSAEYGSNGIQYRSGWRDDKRPWRMFLDSVNYYYYADSRYVKKAGDTMTGDLAMDTNKGFYIPHRTRVVKTSGNWIHGGADVASSTDANLRFASWYGIGWYPTISGQTVAQGKNAMWLNVRNGNLDTHGAITAHTNYLAANWDSARRLVLGGGSSYAWIDSRNSSNSVLCNILLYDNRVVIGNYAESRRFVSTVGKGTQPYQCSSTTLNSNLNADLFDNWHLNFFPRNYNNARTYAVQFALGSTDNNWRKIFACSESETGPYKSVTVWGQIWYAYGNHAQSEVFNYHFCAIFYMRSGPSSSDSSVGNVENSARLYLPTFAKGMDNIRLVRVGTNNFELQVRQIGSYHNGHIQYQFWSYGCNVSAWENLQSTSNTSVAVSAGGASTLADSRASSADVLTTSRTLWGRPFNGSSNIDGNIDNAAVITSKGGIWLDLKGSSGVAFYSGGSLCAVINNTGVGIGTSSPSQKLHVAGNIIATGAITAKASSSDIRLKTDIQGYDAMGIIRKFRSVKYHWNAIAKENSEVFNHDNWNYGLIAQDLLSGGYSQWVKDAFNDYYTIDYERLIPVVWKGLQEVDDEVTRLKKRVRELEKRLGINN